jgi:hypothetical protein
MMSVELASLSLHIQHSSLKIRASRVWPSSSDRIGDLVAKSMPILRPAFPAERKRVQARLLRSCVIARPDSTFQTRFYPATSVTTTR